MPSIAIIAFGFGMVLLSAQIASVTGARPSEVGLASGPVNAFQPIGRVVGLTTLLSISITELSGVIRIA